MLHDLPLTRTAALTDFPGCPSAAVWQQIHAMDAYYRWMGGPALRPAGTVICHNWGAASFHAPGVDPIYRSYGDPDGSVRATDPPLSVIFAFSVLDRVDSPMRLLRRVTDRLTTGGLLVCTFALWDATGADCAVGHELRHRIYDRETWRRLLHDIRPLGLMAFGGVDLRYHGDVLGDHTLGALVAVKEAKA